MGLITSPVPEIGSPNATEQVDVTNLLTEIKNLLNGSLDSTNLSVALKAAISAPVGTAFPSTPTDDARYVYRSPDGVLWPFRYNASSTSTFKWEAVGATPLIAENSNAGDFTTATTYQPASGGPGITPPLAGEYIVTVSALAYPGSPGAGGFVAPQFGTAPVLDTDRFVQPQGDGVIHRGSRAYKRTLDAGVGVSIKFRSTNGGRIDVNHGSLSITPIRVSG